MIALLISASPALALPAEKLAIDSHGKQHHFTVEVARTPQEQRNGLMHRTKLARDHGMLFLMPTERNISMWMKDTPLPLDMLFIDPTGRIIYIAPSAKPNSTKVIKADKPSLAVIELLGGTAEKDGIAAGDYVLSPEFKK